MEFQLLALKLQPRCAGNITSRTYKQSSDTDLVNCVMIMLAIPAAGQFDYSDLLHSDRETLQRLPFLLLAAAARFLRE